MRRVARAAAGPVPATSTLPAHLQVCGAPLPEAYVRDLLPSCHGPQGPARLGPARCRAWGADCWAGSCASWAGHGRSCCQGARRDQGAGPAQGRGRPGGAACDGAPGDRCRTHEGRADVAAASMQRQPGRPGSRAGACVRLHSCSCCCCWAACWAASWAACCGIAWRLWPGKACCRSCADRSNPSCCCSRLPYHCGSGQGCLGPFPGLCLCWPLSWGRLLLFLLRQWLHAGGCCSTRCCRRPGWSCGVQRCSGCCSTSTGSCCVPRPVAGQQQESCTIRR